MRQYTDQEKLFVLEQSESAGGKNMSTEHKGRIVREFRERFSRPNFTEERLYMLLWKLRDQNSRDFKSSMLLKQLQAASKRGTERQLLKDNKSKALKKSLWRAQLDLTCRSFRSITVPRKTRRSLTSTQRFNRGLHVDSARALTNL